MPGVLGAALLVGSGVMARMNTRDTVEQVRSASVNDECIVELDFEHEGHLYSARRTISGGQIGGIRFQVSLDLGESTLERVFVQEAVLE